jgi:hypothetical protein
VFARQDRPAAQEHVSRLPLAAGPLQFKQIYRAAAAGDPQHTRRRFKDGARRNRSTRVALSHARAPHLEYR